jgi:hypothetical protein
MSGNQYVGNLSADGDYRIRVYLYRNAARAGEAANYRLEIGIDAAGSSQGATQPSDADDPWTRIGMDKFDATSETPCARHAGQPTTACGTGVVRMGGGSAFVKVTWPDGGNRIITFEIGVPTGYDESQADGGAKLTYKKNADLHMISIGNQRFEIPEAVVYGG